MSFTRKNIIWTWRTFYLAQLSDSALQDLLQRFKNEMQFTALAVPIDARFSAEGILGVNQQSKEQYLRIYDFARAVGLPIFTSMFINAHLQGDIHDKTIRSRMVNELTNKIVSLPSNGHMDDLEVWSWGPITEADYIAWSQAISSAARNLGKFIGIYLLASTYPYQSTRLKIILPELDVDVVVFANSLGVTNPEYVQLLEEYLNCPYTPHFVVAGGDLNASLQKCIDHWEKLLAERTLTRLQGFSVWAYPFMTIGNSEWNIWLAWDKKGGYNEPIVPQPEPTPPPPPKGTFMARTIGPLGIPESVLRQLWRLRQKYIRPEVHKKLHPMV